MSRLEELLQEYCPYGVEYKLFGQIAVIVRGASPRPIKAFITDNEDGINWIKIGDVDPGSKYVTKTHEKITKEGAKKSRFVNKGDFILSNSMSFGRPYILKIDGCIHDGWLSISKFEDELTADFLYYVLVSTPFQNEMAKKASFGGAVQNLNADIVKSIEIPIPPLPVQLEIVRILDEYTEKATELNASLEAELTARKKQYEYYRDELLNPKDEFRLVKLKEVAEYSQDRINADIVNEETYVGVDNLLPNKQGKRMSDYVPSTGRLTGYCKEDILIGNIRPYLKKIWFADNSGGTNGDVLDIRVKNCNELKPKYLYYILASESFFNYDNSNSKGSKMPRGDKKAVMEYEFPLISIDEQERVINILDRFETLSNSVETGLPAEIAARQKQYEHYRDKLLTFKRKES